MFAVAIIELATTADEEAEILADEVGLTAYDLRLRLAGMLPAIVLTTADKDKANVVLRAIRARGHGAVGCDLRSIVAGTSMVAMRRFVLGDASMRADRDSRDELPYQSIQSLVHAAHPELHQVIGHEMVLRGRGGMARIETLTNEHDAQQSLYIFRNDDGLPWILREQDAHYSALGPALGFVQRQNFLVAIGMLRARAPRAHFDDRLAVHPRSPQHFERSFGRPDGGASPWVDHGADLAAQLLALWFSRGSSSPYRS